VVNECRIQPEIADASIKKIEGLSRVFEQDRAESPRTRHYKNIVVIQTLHGETWQYPLDGLPPVAPAGFTKFPQYSSFSANCEKPY
jgi:hypothetical protein